jgi:predicted YcjX-like family ATPase
MSAPFDNAPADATVSDEVNDERRVAYSYVEDAFNEAQHDGLDSDALAHAALFAALRTLVETYGEEATAVFTEALPQKVRTGAFTRGTRH